MSPAGTGSSSLQLGRAVGSLFTDQIFCQATAYKASSRAGLLRGLQTSVREMTVLPPAVWDPTLRLEPPKNPPTLEARLANRIAIKEKQRDFEDDDGYVEEDLEDFVLKKVSKLDGETLTERSVRKLTTALTRLSSSLGSSLVDWWRMFAGSSLGTGQTSLTLSTSR